MKHSKETLDVVQAAMALAARDVELGLIDHEDLETIKPSRYAPYDRKVMVNLLKAEGKNYTQIAAKLKVARSTVKIDVEGPKSPRKMPKSPPPETDDDPDLNEARAESIRQNFLVRADRAAEAAAYHGQVDEEVRRAVTRTAIAWNNLARTIGE